MFWKHIAPVLISIGIIILIAILRTISKPIAAIVATMPVNIVLAYYILYAAEEGNQVVMAQFSGSMLVGLIGTVVFMVGMWLVSRAGWRIIPTLLASYAAWAGWVAITFGMGRIFGQ